MSQDQRLRFCLIRAFSIGHVQRGEICEVFDVSPAQGTRTLALAVEAYPKLLRHRPRGKGIEPIPGAQRPREATPALIIQAMSEGQGWAQTGVRPEEWGVRLNPYPTPPFDQDVLNELIRALARARQAPLEVLYGGMRRGETPTWRVVIPMLLEFTGRQWRLIALDTHSEQPRTYVLPRIEAARVAAAGVIKPKQLRRLQEIAKKNVGSDNQLYTVCLNPRLNESQKSAIKCELGITEGREYEGTLMLSRRYEHEFKRLYLDEPVADGVVWPPIIEMKPKN